MNAIQHLSRRNFCRYAVGASAAALLTACTQGTTTPSPQSSAMPSASTNPTASIIPTRPPAQIAPTTGATPQAAATPSAAVPAGKFTTPQGRNLPDDAAPLEKQVLYDVGGEPKHLDVVRDLYSAAAVLNYGGEPLLRLNENYDIVPALAESYKVGPGAEYVDFVIRKDAKWSDGTPITPEDWIFTFRHAADPKLDNPWAFFYYAIKGVKAAKEGKGPLEAIGVEKVDERTVRIYGEGPAPQIPALMTYQGSVPAPKHRAESDPLHWADSAEGFVSSGPYKLTKWEHNQRMEWEINPFYNGPHKPGIQRVSIQLVSAAPGAPSTLNAFLNKEVDMLASLDQSQLPQVKANPELNKLLHSFNNFETKYVSFDTFNPPFNNLKLRQALSHAVDRDTLCKNVLQGTAVPAYSMLPPGFPAYNAELRSIQNFDPAKAKALLAEAGYPGGKDASGNQLSLELSSEGGDIKTQFLQDQWQQLLGIKVTIKPLEGTVWSAQRRAHAMPLFINRYEYDYIDPSNLLTSIWQATSEKGAPTNTWKNDNFDTLVTNAGKEGDAQKRIALYQQAEKILVEDVGGIFLAHNVIYQVWWPYITGIKPDETGNVAFHYLDISRFQMYVRNDVDQYRKAR